MLLNFTPVINHWVLPGINLNAAVDRNKPAMPDVFTVVCNYYGFDESQYCTGSRTQENVLIRRWFSLICCSIGYTTLQVAEFIGKDHSTVVISNSKTLSDLSLYKSDTKALAYFSSIINMPAFVEKCSSPSLKKFLYKYFQPKR